MRKVAGGEMESRKWMVSISWPSFYVSTSGSSDNSNGTFRKSEVEFFQALVKELSKTIFTSNFLLLNFAIYRFAFQLNLPVSWIFFHTYQIRNKYVLAGEQFGESCGACTVGMPKLLLVQLVIISSQIYTADLLMIDFSLSNLMEFWFRVLCVCILITTASNIQLVFGPFNAYVTTKIHKSCSFLIKVITTFLYILLFLIPSINHKCLCHSQNSAEEF